MKYSLNKNLFSRIYPKIVIVVLTSVMLSGCLPTVGSSQKLPKPEGEFKKGAVISGFPPIPSYPKATVVESYGSSQSFGASLLTDDSLPKVFDFYNVSFGPLGWNATAHKKTDTNIVYDVKSDKYVGQVIINTASDNKKTAITIALSAK